MAYMLIQHEVKDYEKWKAVFDDVAELRRSNGEQSARIFHDAENPNRLTLLFEWDSLENARAYAQNPALKAAMQEAGVRSAPTFHFLKEE
jgi:quinol monooxygenase YgiN